MLLACLALSLQVGEIRDYVMTADKAFILLPPQVVAGPRAQLMTWSPDGKHLAIVQSEEEPTRAQVEAALLGKPSEPAGKSFSVILWPRGGRAATVFSGDSTVKLGLLQWLGASGDLVAVVEIRKPGQEYAEERQALLLGTRGAKVLYKGDRYTRVSASAASTQPLGALVLTPPPVAVMVGGKPTPIHTEIRLIDRTGLLDPVFKVDLDTTHVYWGNGRSTPFVFAHTPNPGQGEWKRLDRQRGLVKEEPKKELPGPPPVLELSFSRVTVPLGAEDETQALTLKLRETGNAKARAALITSDAEKAILAPSGDAVAYTIQGAVFVREWVEAPRTAFLQLQERTAREELIDKVKAIEVGLSVYRADNDGAFPASAGWHETLKPYLRDPSVGQGFNYTFRGGTLPPGSDPKTFAIGFLTGSGGRAVLYADGSVRWEK